MPRRSAILVWYGLRFSTSSDSTIRLNEPLGPGAV